MDLSKLSKKLRLILYQYNDCQTLSTEFERVLSEYGLQGIVNIFDEKKGIVVDVESIIQLTKKKKINPIRVYEVIPSGSPLQKFIRSGWNGRDRFEHRKTSKRTVQV